MQIAITLDRDSPQSLQQQVYAGIRSLILSGAITPGQRLPSTRELARMLDISRTTATLSYDLLESEGYIRSRGAVGTFVNKELPELALSARVQESIQTAGWQHINVTPLRSREPADAALSTFATTLSAPRSFAVGDGEAESPSVNLGSNTPSVRDFPFELWRQLANRVLKHTRREALGYTEFAGCLALKDAIARYLGPARGVNCTPAQVIVTAGSKQALDLIARVHLNAGDAAICENPGYPGARFAFQAQGARQLPIDSRNAAQSHATGILQGYEQFRPKLLYVTPSHQFPLGGTMPLEARLQLLQWAHDQACLVIEDDYDSEFRYGERPLSSLQGLDQTNKNVIYVGTFSKLIFPALRIGYIVVPPHLINAYRKFQDALYGQPPYLEQLILANFLNEGHLDRHIRRMRVLYAERRQTAVNAFSRVTKDARILGDSAGMHFVLRTNATDETALTRRALLSGIALRTTEYAYQSGYEPTELVIGYGSLTTKEIQFCARTIKRILHELSTQPAAPLDHS